MSGALPQFAAAGPSSDDVPLSWTATTTEPASVAGKATHKTTGKAKKNANAKSVVFKAGTKKLKKITHIKSGKKLKASRSYHRCL